MKNNPSFGPGGNCQAFYASGGKATIQAPAWVKSQGLSAYEYEAGNGLRTSPATLMAIRDAAREADVSLSLHAPYFISLSGVEATVRENSVRILGESMAAAAYLGAKTVVVHTGSAAKISRETAMNYAADTLLTALDNELPDDVYIGLETMGKQNQLGTLEEVLALCKLHPRLRPVIDFGHMNARECGNLFHQTEDYIAVLSRIGMALGDEILDNLHCHFSKIEWTKAGEKKHLTFEDTLYGPPFEPLCEAIAKLSISPTIICESAGTQTMDARAMKMMYEQYKK